MRRLIWTLPILVAAVWCPPATGQDAPPPGPGPALGAVSNYFDAAPLPKGRFLCMWKGPGETGQGAHLYGGYYSAHYVGAYTPMPLVNNLSAVNGLALAGRADAPGLWLFTAEPGGVFLRQSTNDGASWSDPERVFPSDRPVLIGNAVAAADGTVVLGLVERSGSEHRVVALRNQPSTNRWVSEEIGRTAHRVSEPIAVAAADGISLFYTTGAQPRRYLQSTAASAGWTAPRWVNLPSAISGDAPERTAAMTVLDDGTLLAAGWDNVSKPNESSVRLSYDGGKTWPVRRVIGRPLGRNPLRIVRGPEGQLHVIQQGTGPAGHLILTEDWALAQTRLNRRPMLANVVPPLEIDAHRSLRDGESTVPIPDSPYIEQVRGAASEADWNALEVPGPAESLPGVKAPITTAVVAAGGREWVGTEGGLYFRAAGSGSPFEWHTAYGGALSTHISGLAADSRGSLWVTSSTGLSQLDGNGGWTGYRGRDGLPWEELTGLAIDGQDRLWIGSTRGVIHFRPYASGRQWFYRAGPRYVPDDHITGIAVAQGGNGAVVRTAEGYGRIEEVERTLHGKAEWYEERLNERGRRLGIPSPIRYDDPYTMDSWTHGPQPSDGLWTSYHVAAACAAYTLTGEDRYRESAAKSMEALYLLQTVTGIPGLVARSVVAVDEPAADEVRDQSNWHPTADGKYLWRDDVSSDQLDGHFLAFYTYFEHVAQFDPEERERLERQIQLVLDYILDNDYQIVDWHGERTLWGWWNPEALNERPMAYLESGLYSLMMLSFLKTAHYVTADDKYLDEFRHLIEDHGYLSNLLLEKKLYPDELNHSDDQLSAVAYYPILQLEHNPFIRRALHMACRRHAYIEQPERNSLFAVVYGSIDPHDADIEGAVQTLREDPLDRRSWRMENSHRADVVARPTGNRGGRPVSLHVLPVDERHFERWNQDPYEFDGGGGGHEGVGEQYLIPYWLGRFHGLIAGPGE